MDERKFEVLVELLQIFCALFLLPDIMREITGLGLRVIYATRLPLSSN